MIQSQVAQCEARLRSSRAYLRGVIGEMWDEARNTGEISAEQHPQLRLAATWAIHQARDVVATVYHAAGATAIFNENPFERRMRDIHAGTQQGQGRAGPFRDRRPDPDGPAAGRTDVPVTAICKSAGPGPR